MIGTRVDSYRIIRLLGEGGMGQVYEAIDERGGGRVAIKTLRNELANDGEMLARFRSEARALSMVKHPGLVEIHGTGVLPSGGAYIAMEFLDGQSLRSRLSNGAVDLTESLRIAQKVAEVLSAVHAQKIVHRDLKPENIMVLAAAGQSNEPRVKVLDFGIAKVSMNTGKQTQVVTRTGVLIGTPSYMAPEQCGGEGEICDRTDVYALGILLYELVAGQPPFLGEVDAQLMGKHLFQAPTPLRQAAQEASSDLELLVHAMLAKKPVERPSMEMVAEALGLLASGKRFSDSQTRIFNLAREASTVRYSQVFSPPAALTLPRWMIFVVAMFVLSTGVLSVLLFRRAPPPANPSAPVKVVPPTNLDHGSPDTGRAAAPATVPTGPTSLPLSPSPAQTKSLPIAKSKSIARAEKSKSKSAEPPSTLTEPKSSPPESVPAATPMRPPPNNRAVPLF